MDNEISRAIAAAGLDVREAISTRLVDA